MLQGVPGPGQYDIKSQFNSVEVYNEDDDTTTNVVPFGSSMQVTIYIYTYVHVVISIIYGSSGAPSLSASPCALQIVLMKYYSPLRSMCCS